MLEGLYDDTGVVFFPFWGRFPSLQKTCWNHFAGTSFMFIHCYPCTVVDPHHERLVFSFIAQGLLLLCEPSFIELLRKDFVILSVIGAASTA